MMSRDYRNRSYDTYCGLRMVIENVKNVTGKCLEVDLRSVHERSGARIRTPGRLFQDQKGNYLAAVSWRVVEGLSLIKGLVATASKLVCNQSATKHFSFVMFHFKYISTGYNQSVANSSTLETYPENHSISTLRMQYKNFHINMV